MAFRLPLHAVIKSINHKDKGHLMYRDSAVREESRVILAESDVFSVVVRMKFVQASEAGNENYVHAKFFFNKRHWQRNVDNGFLFTGSKEMCSDPTDPLCTLYEPVKVDNNGTFYLTHVHSGGRVVLDEASMAFKVELNPSGTNGYLSFLDFAALYKLPMQVSFLAGNGRYLQAFDHGKNYLMFKGVGATEYGVDHTVAQLPDGHVRLKSHHFRKFWKRDGTSVEWVCADSAGTDENDKNTQFWPVWVDENTVGLRCAGNAKFCKRLTDKGLTNCLSASVATITLEAKLGVKDLTAARKISDVVFRLQYAQLYNQEDHVAGNATVYNRGDKAASVEFDITYEDKSQYDFSRTEYMAGGTLPISIVGVRQPFINNEGEVVLRDDAVTIEAIKWLEAVKSTPSVTVRGAVTVPAKSQGVVSYEGTYSSFRVPFYYHQTDRNSIDAKITESQQFDGYYDAGNLYEMKFVLGTTRPVSG